MEKIYRRQVDLLLKVLPEVEKEKCFALHGGTAINLFVRNMPRLSVDIDLTYLLIEDRKTSLTNIVIALERIKNNIERIIPQSQVIHNKENGKLLITVNSAAIKLEVNLVNRGTLAAPREMTLCENAQNEFQSFCTMPVVSTGQLFGGKIIAALDRQHPRDLFDVKNLLNIEGFTQEVKEGVLHYMLCSVRPINEIIRPNFIDQRATMENQFSGMTDEAFTYEEFEQVREKLVETIHAHLTDKDRKFLLSIKNINPDWTAYDFQHYPAIKWKLQNLQNLKEKNQKKHQELYSLLEKQLYP